MVPAHAVKLSMVAFVLAASVLMGCSGIKAYPNDLGKNLHVRTTAESGSWLSSMRTVVDIHRVGADCTTEYQGTVQLKGGLTKIGIPPERWTRLVFVFASSSFLANSNSSITYETLLNPRAGYAYDLQVMYEDDLYDVSIQETKPGQPTSRRIEHRPLSACHMTNM